MKNLALLAFILIFPGAYAQETQNALVLQEGIKKIVLTPKNLFYSGLAIFQKGYNSYSRDFKRTAHFKSLDSNQVFAYNHNFISSPHLFSFDKVLSGENNSSRSCDEVCPQGLAILSIQRDKLFPSRENYLSFRNIAEDYADSIKKQTGYCWGHTSVLDDFSYLAFFDKNNVTGQEVGEDQVAFYKNLIDQIIVHGRAVIIPGFSNLRELSEVPEIKAYLKVRVARKWAKNALKLRGVGNLLFDGRKMKIKRTKKLLEKIRMRLLSNQTPRIMFGARNDASYSHVLNVYGLSKQPNGSHRLYLLETNFFPEDVPKDHHYIEIDTEGNARYARLVETRLKNPLIGKIKFTFEEKKDTVGYIKSLQRFCREVSQCH